MPAKKLKTIVVKLVSTLGTGFFYTTTRRTTLENKLLLRKYDPVVRQHTWFEEEKISRKRIVQRKRK
jgi:large subunit ribosomal protein L33